MISARQVFPKNLWIEKVNHVLKLASLRIKGSITNKEPVLPLFKTPVVGASLFGDNLAGCLPNRLHLLATAALSNSIKTKQNKSVTALSGSLKMKTLITKKLIISLGIIFLLTRPVFGQVTFGARDCGQWVTRTELAKVIREAWFVGYMSGLNAMGVMSGKIDVLEKVNSAEQLYLWMDNYCNKNPLNLVSTGANVLFLELARK